MPSPRTNPAMPEVLELGEFVRGLAHDFANPLNAIAMNAELVKVLLDRGDAAAAREGLEHLLSDCTRCGRLVQSVQRFGASLQAGAREEVAAGALVQSAIALMQDELPDTGIEFHVAGATDAPLAVDHVACTRALCGILRNAAEAGATTIRIDIARADRRVHIDIADNGCGIEARWLAHATEPFFTTRRAQGGSGLGLTLAGEIARRHAGTLDISSDADRGTRVILELPES